MKKLSPQLFKNLLIIREYTGLNLAIKPMKPENHKLEIDKIKTNIMAGALAKVSNCSVHLRSLVNHAYDRAARADNTSVQGKLSVVSMKLNELLELLDDPEIHALVEQVNNEDMNRIKRP